VSLEEKLQEHCTSVNITKKTVQRRFSTGQLGKGNSEEMCLQMATEGAECL